jgi:exopolysaccharide production protein ExoY
MAFISKDISSSARDAVGVASREMVSVQHLYRPCAAGPAARREVSFYRRFAKRALDVAFVTLAVPFWAPLVLVCAILVAFDGHNPFYSQARIGRNGRVFRMWKVRSMVPDADAFLDSYLTKKPEARSEWDATQKLKNDPRITVVGSVLRKTSLDELPQLFNVLNGDMSLVGPRPMMVSQKALYPGNRYYDLRPGVTGLWQVTDRNECSFAERANFDDAYHGILSFRADIKILLRTVGVVMRGTGY